MSKPHRIRLVGPWEYRAQSDEQPRRETFPLERERFERLVLNRPQASFERIFHSPTGLTTADQVALEIVPWPLAIRVTLNNHTLGTLHPIDGSGLWLISPWLQSTNRLTISLERCGPPILSGNLGHCDTAEQSNTGASQSGTAWTAEPLIGHVWLAIQSGQE